MRLWLRARMRLLPVLIGFTAGCAPEPPELVLLVMADALRADRLGSYGYHVETSPELDRIAAEGAVYLNHFANSTATRESLPQLFYSRYFVPPLFPASANVPLTDPVELFHSIDDRAVSIPEAFSLQGYRTVGISAHSWLSSESDFARMFDEFHDLSATLTFPSKRAFPSAEQVTEFAVELLDRLEGQRVLLYVHYMDTHFPHFLDEDAAALFSGDQPPLGFDRRGFPRGHDRALEGNQRAYLDALYDGSVRYLDRAIGELIGEVRSSGFSWLFAFTSDHGEHLLHVPGRFEHGGPWYDAASKVPLIIVAPGKVEPARIQELSSAVDVLPTLLQASGLEAPAGAELDGESLIHTGREPDIYSPGGIRTSTEKLLLHGNPVEGVRASAYYLIGRDQLELTNELEGFAKRVEDLKQQWSKVMIGPWRRYEASGPKPIRGPFAIAAQDFVTTPAAISVTSPEEIEEIDAGWMIYHHWRDSVLAGVDSQVELSIRIPDGTYDVAPVFEGACKWSASDSLEVAKGDSLGRVRVRGRPFHLGLLAGPDGCRVYRMSFSPAERSEETGADQKRDERLRTLGYVG